MASAVADSRCPARNDEQPRSDSNDVKSATTANCGRDQFAVSIVVNAELTS